VEGNYEYKPVLFFLMAYVVTWIPWSLAMYAGSQPGLEAYAFLFNLIGLLGPLAVALILILTSGSKARRIRPIYAIVAIAMPPAVMCLSIWLSVWFGQSADQFRLSGGANLLAMIILAMVLAPLFEEMGWHGYGVDSLRAKTGMMKATLLFGALWSTWHAPLVLISGTYQNELARMGNKVFLANFFVSIIPAAIIANWFYYKNSRSIAAAILVHSMLNAPSVLLYAGQIAKCIATLLYAGIAAGLIVGDRAAFAEGSRNFLSKASPNRRDAS